MKWLPRPRRRALRGFCVRQGSSSLFCLVWKPRRQNDHRESARDREWLRECAAVRFNLHYLLTSKWLSSIIHTHAHTHRGLLLQMQAQPMCFGVCWPDHPWWWFVPNSPVLPGRWSFLSRYTVFRGVSERERERECARERATEREREREREFCFTHVFNYSYFSPFVFSSGQLGTARWNNSKIFLIYYYLLNLSGKEPIQRVWWGNETGRHLQCDWKMIYLVSMFKADRSDLYAPISVVSIQNRIKLKVVLGLWNDRFLIFS